MIYREHSVESRAGGSGGKVSASDSVTHETCRRLAQKFFDKKSTVLFQEYTGMPAAVKWAPPPHLPWRSVLPEGGLSGYCRLICSKKVGRSMCRQFAAGQLTATLARSTGGHRFICSFGVRSQWIPIKVRGHMVGIALCQAQCRPTSHRAEERVAALGFTQAELKKARGHLCALTKSDFDRASRFLELIVDHVCEQVENDLEREELKQATSAVANHEKLETRLRKELNHVLPHIHENAAELAKEGHSQKVLRLALEYTHENYHRPLHQQEVAEMVGLNGSYFSTLFARYVGIPFSRYLRELRLEKAQELLHDPRRRIADVADNVGYADPNSFRLAFKKMTGLSPTAWRDTFTSGQ